MPLVHGDARQLRDGIEGLYRRTSQYELPSVGRQNTAPRGSGLYHLTSRRISMRAFLKAAALAAAVSLAALPLLLPAVSLAQDAVSSMASIASSIPPDSSIVTVPIGDWATPIVEVFGAILMAAVSSLVAIVVGFAPQWLRPLITTVVQNAISAFIRQGIGYAIQWVVGFDKGKTIDLNVGSTAVAVALRYVVDHAPDFLLKWAGGEDAIKEKIIALLGEFGITLDDQTSPAAVANHPAVLAVSNG